MKLPKVPYYIRHGQIIVDATEDLPLNVTPTDINKGIPSNPNECAIAQSGKRNGKIKNKNLDILDISVNNEIVLILGANGFWRRYFLKQADTKMIDLFDKTLGYFRPGVYTLHAPTPSQQIGARRGKASGSSTRTGKTRTVTSQLKAKETRPRPSVSTIG